MQDLIMKLLDEGYEVSLVRKPEGYIATVDRCEEGAVGFGETCIAATPLDALVGAAPQALSYEACMVPEGEHPYPDGPDCFCGHACRYHSVNAVSGAERPACTVDGCACPYYGYDTPELQGIVSLDERVTELEGRSDRDVRLLIRIIGDLMAESHPEGHVAAHGDAEQPAPGPETTGTMPVTVTE